MKLAAARADAVSENDDIVTQVAGAARGAFDAALGGNAARLGSINSARVAGICLPPISNMGSPPRDAIRAEHTRSAAAASTPFSRSTWNSIDRRNVAFKKDRVITNRVKRTAGGIGIAEAIAPARPVRRSNRKTRGVRYRTAAALTSE